MDCVRVLKKLNRAKIKGYKYLIVKNLNERERQEIIECGFFIKKLENGYKISEYTG